MPEKKDNWEPDQSFPKVKQKEYNPEIGVLNQIELKRKLARLTKEQRIIVEKLSEGFSLGEIAEQLGKSVEYITEVAKKLKGKLR